MQLNSNLIISSINLASNVFLSEKVLPFVTENDMNFLGAVATDVWSKHDEIR